MKATPQHNQGNEKKESLTFMITNLGMDFFVGYFLSEFFHPTELISIFTVLNRGMRKCILQSSKLWKRQFELLYPNLIDLVNDWINLKLWNDQRGERLDFLKEEGFKFYTPYSGDTRLCNETDYKIVESSCKSQFVHFLSLIILDHSFYETNFNSEYNWNQNCLNDLKYHQVHYSTYLKFFKFFHLLIETRSLVSGNDICVQDLMNKLSPKHNARKLYQRLLTDLLFKSNFPCSAMYFLIRGYSCTDRYSRDDEGQEIVSLPFIDFGFETGLVDPSFTIYPEICATENNSQVKEFKCKIIYCIHGEKQKFSFTYPTEFDKLLKLFERYLAANEEIDYNVSVDNNFLARTLTLASFLTEKTYRPLNKHYVRRRCVSPSVSLRIFFQSQVDRNVKQISKNFKFNLPENQSLLCSHLSKYPSNLEINNLLASEDLSFLDIISNGYDFYKLNFIKQRKELWETYIGEFEIEKFFIRSVDKCLRRYLHLFVFSQPSLIESTHSCTFQSCKLSITL